MEVIAGNCQRKSQCPLNSLGLMGPWGGGEGNCCGFTSWLSLQCGVYSRELPDKKSVSPLFPGADGAMGGGELLWFYQLAVSAVWGL